MSQKTNASMNGEIEIDLHKLLLAYLKRWWLIALCVLLGACIAFVYSRFFVTPLYRASTSMIINNYGGTSESDTFSDSQYKASQTLASGYVATIKSHRVLGEVARRLDGAYTVPQLEKIVAAEQKTNTPILYIHATTPDPETSMRIANTVADVAPDVVRELLEGGTAKVLDPAELPKYRYSPSYTKNTLIGGAIGLILALGYLTLAFLLDVRIKDEEELTEICKYPVLGQIPDFALMNAHSGKHGYGYGYGYGYGSGSNRTPKYTLPDRKADKEGENE